MSIDKYVEANEAACQHRCAVHVNCAFFSFWPVDGGCHLSDSNSKQVPDGSSVSGPWACGATMTTTMMTTMTTTTTGWVGTKVLSCKVWADPQLDTFDGAIAMLKEGRHNPSPTDMQSIGDNFDMGDFYLVKSDNIQIQARFRPVGGRVPSSITEARISGSALGGKLVTIANTEESTAKVFVDGAEINLIRDSDSMYGYNHAGIHISVKEVEKVFLYSLKFGGDDSVQLFFEFVGHGCVGGLCGKLKKLDMGRKLDMTILMKEHGGVSGLCGDMDGNWKNDVSFNVNGVSKVPDRSSLFSVPNPDAGKKVSHKCAPTIEDEAKRFCENKHQMESSSQKQMRINSCIFDFCFGGKEEAMAESHFLDAADAAGSIANGQKPKNADLLGNFGKVFAP